MVNELESEVSNNPEEWREIFCIIFGFNFFLVLWFDVNILGDIDDQIQILDGIFINTSHGVIDKTRTQENGETENSIVMVCVFI